MTRICVPNYTLVLLNSEWIRVFTNTLSIAQLTITNHFGQSFRAIEECAHCFIFHKLFSKKQTPNSIFELFASITFGLWTLSISLTKSSKENKNRTRGAANFTIKRALNVVQTKFIICKERQKNRNRYIAYV